MRPPVFGQLGVLLLFACTTSALAMQDNPLVAGVFLEELEAREDDGLVWDIEAWAGYDRNRLWFKSEGEKNSGDTEEFETQLLYNRALTPFWNLQTGWRGDWQPGSRRSWAVVGLAGLVPGMLETELTGFAADGRAAARLKLRYELWLSQRFKLAPRLETNWFSKSDPVNQRGDGITDLELALRLHYIIRPNIKPYVGVTYTGFFGETADFVTAEGDRDRRLQLVAGLNYWF